MTGGAKAMLGATLGLLCSVVANLDSVSGWILLSLGIGWCGFTLIQLFEVWIGDL